MANRYPDPPKVLIVEPDRMLASETVIACLEMGLEPKLCRGPDHTDFCPGLVGFKCPRAKGVDAVLVSITKGWESQVIPACSDGAPLIVATPRGTSRTRREVIAQADALLDHPYYPDEAANLLGRLAAGHDRI